MSELTQIDIARNDPDWKLRCQAVEKITDEDVLKDIFKNDSIVMVKISAMRQIKDIDFLHDECLNNPQGHIRRAILSHILDEGLLDGDNLNSLLKDLTLNDPEDLVSQVACENLSTDFQDVFVDVASSLRDVRLRCEAISKITDEDLLRDFAINDDDRFIRLEAIRNPNLVNINALAEIIENEDDEFNRMMAIMKIPGCESLLLIIFDNPLYPRLAEIASNITFSCKASFLSILKNDDDSYNRIVAVNFIESQEILEGIVLDSSDDRLIAEAVKNPNFKNQKILLNLIQNESSEKVLLQAIDRIDDENVLIDYVSEHLSASNPTFKAISKITDFEFLENLYNSENQQIQFYAVKRMIELKYNLAFIAKDNPNMEIRLEAIGAMSDKYMLAKIASETADRDIAIVALGNIVPDKMIKVYLPKKSIIRGSLNDITFNSQIWGLATQNKDPEIRKLAISKLNEKDVLDEIIESSRDFEIVDAAKNRLDSLWKDIKLISDEDVLNVIAQKGDEDIKSAVSVQIDDLKTWRERIAKINDITDISQLKDIANNDYNYFVRCEAEGKLESLIFDIRLDEIRRTENQNMLRQIADDETYPLEIRKKASSRLLK